MKRYLDSEGNSGVSAYEAGPDFILIRFKGGATYLYTAESAGAANIKRMKALASRGDGLAAFISRKVHDHYARKVA